MKRVFDVLASFFALVLLLPLLLTIALLVAIGSSGGVFFRQRRVGKHGKPFSLLKFRSMRRGAESSGRLTIGARDPRITGIGHFLRRTKLDELPQLWNVLIGDMSLVGPRPEVPEYVAMYTDEQRQVLSVRPGLTSLASLEYINENALLGASDDPTRTYVEEIMPAKLALDRRYLRERSFSGDIVLIMRTVTRIIK